VEWLLQKGKPYLDAVELVNIPDDMTAAAAFRKGEITTMSTRDAAILKDLKDANVSVIASYLTLAPDSAHPNSPFSDLKVRQAVAYAIDCNTLQKSFAGDLWTYSNQLVDKWSIFYTPNIIGYPYNVQKAKDLLASSRYPNGFKVDYIYQNQYNNGSLAAAIQAMLAKINVQVNLKPLGSAEATALRTEDGKTVFCRSLWLRPWKRPDVRWQANSPKIRGCIRSWRDQQNTMPFWIGWLQNLISINESR